MSSATPEENAVAAEFAERLGVKPTGHLPDGTPLYDLFEIAAAMGLSAERVFEEASSVEEGVILVTTDPKGQPL